MFPPLIDSLVSRKGSGLHLAKNIFIILFGVVGGIVGTVTSIMSVISVLTSSTGEDECVVSFYSFKISVHDEIVCTFTLICY